VGLRYVTVVPRAEDPHRDVVVRRIDLDSLRGRAGRLLRVGGLDGTLGAAVPATRLACAARAVTRRAVAARSVARRSDGGRGARAPTRRALSLHVPLSRPRLVPRRCVRVGGVGLRDVATVAGAEDADRGADVRGAELLRLGQ